MGVLASAGLFSRSDRAVAGLIILIGLVGARVPVGCLPSASLQLSRRTALPGTRGCGSTPPRLCARTCQAGRTAEPVVRPVEPAGGIGAAPMPPLAVPAGKWLATPSKVWLAAPPQVWPAAPSKVWPAAPSKVWPVAPSWSIPGQDLARSSIQGFAPAPSTVDSAASATPSPSTRSTTRLPTTLAARRQPRAAAAGPPRSGPPRRHGATPGWRRRDCV